MLIRCILFLGIMLGTLGCRGSPIADLKAPEKLTLYSLDGREERPEGEVKTPSKESFHGYPVLGKTEISLPEQRRELLTALNEAIKQHEGKPMAKCFWPRHAIRAIENGKTIDYIICFECSRFREFLGDKQQREVPINPMAQPTFDTPLRDLGIPIAPK